MVERGLSVDAGLEGDLGLRAELLQRRTHLRLRAELLLDVVLRAEHLVMRAGRRRGLGCWQAGGTGLLGFQLDLQAGVGGDLGDGRLGDGGHRHGGRQGGQGVGERGDRLHARSLRLLSLDGDGLAGGRLEGDRGARGRLDGEGGGERGGLLRLGGLMALLDGDSGWQFLQQIGSFLYGDSWR